MILIPPASISLIQRTTNPAALNRSLNHVSLRFAPLSPNPLILFSLPPWRRRREGFGFTLIELMAATTVLSIILLMMVGMQDQMSKAWSNSNRRTDATREARAAVSLMAADLTCPIFRAPTNSSPKDQFADSLLNKGLPFVYSSNGTGSGLTITNLQSGSSCLFFVAPKKTSGTNSSDLALIGYFVGQTNGTNINGFPTTSYNLYRYYVTNSAPPLASWFATPTIGNLFAGVAANSEMLARNVANLQIIFYNEEKVVVDGSNYTNTTSTTNPTGYRGNKLQIALTLYPEEIAQKFTSLQNWTNSENIKRYARSFEFRVDCPRD
jgi:prepilin-type N-terminal cleavage/methylation domain-containing protein